MNIIQLPNLLENPSVIQPTIINNKNYLFEYTWIEDFCILSITLDDVPLIKGFPLVIGTDIIARVKNDDLITGSLYLINKFNKSVEPTQENFNTDYYFVWVE